jgi:hypothetical protein
MTLVDVTSRLEQRYTRETRDLPWDVPWQLYGWNQVCSAESYTITSLRVVGTKAAPLSADAATRVWPPYRTSLSLPIEVRVCPHRGHGASGIVPCVSGGALAVGTSNGSTESALVRPFTGVSPSDTRGTSVSEFARTPTALSSSAVPPVLPDSGASASEGGFSAGARDSSFGASSPSVSHCRAVSNSTSFISSSSWVGKDRLDSSPSSVHRPVSVA